MKKYLLMSGAALASVGSVFAQAAETPNTDVITGTDGILSTVQGYITTAANNSWSFIGAIVGVGLLIWLGRAMLRAIRAYFTTAM